MKCIYFIIVCFFLVTNTACTTFHLQNSTLPSVLLHDKYFPNFQAIPIESESDIFNLSDDAKAFVDEAMSESDDPKQQMRALADAIFDHAQLDLLYLATANTVADDTFSARAANCLSMSIMTYAMAKHAGFQARFQDVAIPDYWTLRDGYSLLNGHINVVISPTPQADVIRLLNSEMEVDFDPQTGSIPFKKRPLAKHHVIALFYNNKGADALVNQNHVAAYAYFRKALEVDPENVSVMVNLGILYRHNNKMKAAETAYIEAIKIDPDNTTSYENLSFLYTLTGRNKKAETVMAVVINRLLRNPNYHINLGELELERQDYTKALEHFKNALRLDNTQHQIYFGLAKVYFELGDLTLSERYLQKAKRNAKDKGEQQRYQSKLDFITKL